MTLAGGGHIYIEGYTTTQTVTTNGVNLGYDTIIFYSEVTVNLDGDLATSEDVYFYRGIINTNNYSITTTHANANSVYIYANYSSPGLVLNLGSSIITCNGFNLNTKTNLTLNEGTSVIKVGSGYNFAGNGETYNEVDMEGGTQTISGSDTFAVLKADAGVAQTIKFTDGTTQTVTTPTLSGSSGKLVTLSGTTPTGEWTIAKAGGGKVYLDYISVDYSTGSPESTWDGGINSTDGGHNVNWTFLGVDISNIPISVDFGVVEPNSTYYAKGTAPHSPVVDGDCTFTVTNTGGGAIDLTISGTNWTGGIGWTLVSGSPGENQIRITVYYEGQDPTSGIILSTSPQLFYSNLLSSGTLNWDFKVETGTNFTDGDEKTSTITLTAVLP